MTFTIKQSDTSPSLRATLQDSNLSPINLNGASIRFHMKALGGVIKVDQPMTIVSAIAGTVKYDWQPADTAVAGTYSIEFEVTYTDLTIETFPNTGSLALVITPELN